MIVSRKLVNDTRNFSSRSTRCRFNFLTTRCNYVPNRVHTERIGELIDAGKPVYVTYQRKNLSAWNEAIDKENVDFGVEIKALKELVKDYPITGLVLDKIVEDVSRPLKTRIKSVVIVTSGQFTQ